VGRIAERFSGKSFKVVKDSRGKTANFQRKLTEISLEKRLGEKT